MLGGTVIEHERSIFNLFDVKGNLGGVQDILVILFGIFISPVSEHYFNLKFLRKLYIIRTKQSNIFQTPIGSPLKKNSKKLKFKNLKHLIP